MFTLKMNSLVSIIILLVLTRLGKTSLLDMSQVLWSRVLGGGYQRIGKLDPLSVPAIKVEQSEGNTSYRVILRNLEISGLNASKIESVQIVRGSLKSNLSDNEAGYVSFNEQRDLDSIRYRFHTLIKEPKIKNDGEDQSASDRLDRIIQFDPALMRVQEENDYSELNRQTGQREGSFQQSRLQESSKTYQTPYTDMKVAINPPLPRTPSSVRLVFSQNYKNSNSSKMQLQNENSRPCIGACNSKIQDERDVLPQNAPTENTNRNTRIYPTQPNADRINNNQESSSSDYVINAQFEKSGFSIDSSNGQQRNRFLAKEGDNFGGYSGQNSENSNINKQYSSNTNRNSGPYFSSNYRNDRTRQFSEPTAQSWNQFSVKGEIPRRGQFSEQQGSASNSYAIKAEYGQPSSSYSNIEVKAGRITAQTKPCDDKDNYRIAPRITPTQQVAPLPVQEFERFRSPLTRIEKQPGYVDIVYASENKEGSESRLDSVKVAPFSDPRVYGLEEIVKNLQNNQRYIIHNFTEGESLNKRNDAARIAAESKRLKDLIRYAKEYQEMHGYFEEGMELIYHFGSVNGTNKMNDTFNRRKRQQLDDEEEDNVMHVVVRVRVPMLSVKSGYELIGKVGKELVRGNGLLTGNFTNVTGDFTVELRKVDNKTMIVRAARAKLLSEDRKINLQGINQNEAIKTILTHGLMAAEAVAAMIADDLATKVLSERNANGMIYKMYTNLPVTEKL